MVILEPLSSSQGNPSYLSVGAVPVQSDGLDSALSPVVYGDIALSINTITIKLQLNCGALRPQLIW